MNALSRLFGLVTAIACVAGLEASADACSPPLPGLTGSIPANGETYPANAALYFLGYDIALGGVTVTVDGQPATLVPAPDAAVNGVEGVTARITSAPAKGQMVKIEGDFCAASGGCGASTITFTAGDSDVTPPSPPASIGFDLYDYPDFKSGGGD